MEQLLITLVYGLIGTVCTFIIVQYIQQFTERVDDLWSFAGWFFTVCIVLFISIYAWKWFFDELIAYIR